MFKRQLVSAYKCTMSSPSTSPFFAGAHAMTAVDSADMIKVYEAILLDNTIDDAYRAHALTPPPAASVAARASASCDDGVFDPVAYEDAHDAVTLSLLVPLRQHIEDTYQALIPALSKPYAFDDAQAVGQRSMRRLTLNAMSADYATAAATATGGGDKCWTDANEA